MYVSRLKALGLYAVVLAAGLGLGRATPSVIDYFKPKYTTGDFRSYLAEHHAKVIVYGTKTCPFCAKTRTLLRDKGVVFADLDVTAGTAQHDFAALHGAAVPLILIGERRVEGYQPAAIVQALAAAGVPVSR